jgi:hypothetical protein
MPTPWGLSLTAREAAEMKAAQGDAVRNLDGWKNSGPPWSCRLDRRKIWFRD